jgi:hypothetical protein
VPQTASADGVQELVGALPAAQAVHEMQAACPEVDA